MPIADYRTYCEMIDRAQAGRFAYPAINVTSLTTANAVLRGLAENKSDFEEFVTRVFDFVNQSPSRVPLTDWYDTRTARQVGFQARSVVGGVFIKMLADQNVWNKWSRR